MKRLLPLIMLLLTQYHAQSQITSDTTKYYSFEINFWFNLHHFLWLESFMNVNRDSTVIRQNLPKETQKKLNEAIDYYKENLTALDLRTSDYMTSFKQWITKQDAELNNVPHEFQQHVDVLQNVREEYDRFFWPAHQKACRQVLDENIELLRNTEEEFVKRITMLTRQFWQFEKLKVDITYFGKATRRNPRNLPYTSLFPTHVVMNSAGMNHVQGNWLELLYHESAHHLILGSSYFVGGTIADVTQIMDIEAPRQLGHAYLFYFTGELTRRLLTAQGVDYDKIYMERNGVFSGYFPLLKEHLRSYMDREITLNEATIRIIKDLR